MFKRRSSAIIYHVLCFEYARTMNYSIFPLGSSAGCWLQQSPECTSFKLPAHMSSADTPIPRSTNSKFYRHTSPYRDLCLMGGLWSEPSTEFRWPTFNAHIVGLLQLHCLAGPSTRETSVALRITTHNPTYSLARDLLRPSPSVHLVG